MLITALGHAGLAVASAGTQVLCDPWFSPEGAFQASWFPFPGNRHLLDSRVFEPDAILLSHEHLDHVDPWFLARVLRHVPVVIPQYPTAALRRKVLAAGPGEVIEVPAWEPVRVAGDLRVFFVMEESPMNHDAAMVVQSDSQVLLNMNDARLTAQQLRSAMEQVGQPVDILALQRRAPPGTRSATTCRRKRCGGGASASAMPSCSTSPASPAWSNPGSWCPSRDHHAPPRAEPVLQRPDRHARRLRHPRPGWRPVGRGLPPWARERAQVTRRLPVRVPVRLTLATQPALR